ncbi:RsfA family transcriptional regulator [Ectobacillus ponti]|uniref:RsfA family transcriptional regulator n=1 Tax=Ectobacillus ponti TaxID=2961894 RepID=A0AA42BRC0_9BACI|nr:RsfA family transcriptional regulator [Ectobacillus ponti]MCP8970256.1 RsfA family transcriptional regulator [Ectobacillus ponti]
MATTRQDAWTEEEDLLLSEVVLRHIREGGTQLSAFKEVGRHLSRTPAACGFRWNSCVRKQYKEQIEEAKQLRKAAMTTKEEPKQYGQVPTALLTLDDVIVFLQQYKESGKEQETQELCERLAQLQHEVEKLQREKEWLAQRLSHYEQQYRNLFEYIDQKRTEMLAPERKTELLRERDVLEQIEK